MMMTHGTKELYDQSFALHLKVLMVHNSECAFAQVSLCTGLARSNVFFWLLADWEQGSVFLHSYGRLMWEAFFLWFGLSQKPAGIAEAQICMP